MTVLFVGFHFYLSTSLVISFHPFAHNPLGTQLVKSLNPRHGLDHNGGEKGKWQGMRERAACQYTSLICTRLTM